jgi:hypothetical protein
MNKWIYHMGPEITRHFLVPWSTGMGRSQLVYRVKAKGRGALKKRATYARVVLGFGVQGPKTPTPKQLGFFLPRSKAYVIGRNGLVVVNGLVLCASALRGLANESSAQIG